jgi:hypothetical protein
MNPILVLSLSSLALFLGATSLPMGHGVKANRKSEVLESRKSNQLDFNSARMLVCEAFSDVFLDMDFDEDQLDQLAKTIADSPFCAQELAHILVFEVAPAEGCLPLKMARSYSPGKYPDRLPFWIHFSVFFANDGYFLLYRALGLRAQ